MRPAQKRPRLVLVSLFIASIIANWYSVSAQSANKSQRASRSQTSASRNRNRTIANIVREIDARNIERTIRQLVSFGTRNTLSEQENDPKRGIGAARDWLYTEFLKAAEGSG